MSDNAQRSASMRKKLSLGPMPKQVDDYHVDEVLEVRWDRIVLVGVLALVLVVSVLWVALRPATDDRASSPPLVHQPGTSSQGEAKQIVPEVKEPENERMQSQDLVQAVNALPAPAAFIAPDVAAKPAAPVKTVQPVVVDLAREVAQMLVIHDARIVQARVLGVGTDFDSSKTPGKRIAMPDTGIVKVELHTSMKALAGQVVAHRWLHNGKVLAKVSIPVTRDEQTSFSSKFINRQMLGDWQVKVTDAQDKVLAQADFTVY